MISDERFMTMIADYEAGKQLADTIIVRDFSQLFYAPIHLKHTAFSVAFNLLEIL